MSHKLSAQILVAFSIAYGVLIAVLASLDTPGLTKFTIIGAVVLGGLWTVRGVFGSRTP